MWPRNDYLSRCFDVAGTRIPISFGGAAKMEAGGGVMVVGGYRSAVVQEKVQDSFSSAGEAHYS